MVNGTGGRRRPLGNVLHRFALLAAACALAACAPAPEPEETPAPVPIVSQPVEEEPTPTPSSSEWPDETNTGVPDGVELTAWTGDCDISEPGTVIDAKRVDCDIRIRAADVRITNSEIHGSVILRDLESGYSFTIADSEIHVGERLRTGLGNGYFTAERVEISGGGRSMYCATDCTLERSWVHGQTGDPGGEAHLSGVRMGQNTTLRFNSIICEGTRTPPGSGCSAALTGYGDFRPIQNNLIEGNYFHSGTASFCAFGGSSSDKPFSDEASDIRFIDNTFERDDDGSCGLLGPIVAFDSDAPGNVWEGNRWSDGEPLPPRN
ncbi:MAG: hypothetical protein GX596_14015 [Propionibacterium sp.]|nr:hypothetical protein [Propionibacterium sp.]